VSEPLLLLALFAAVGARRAVRDALRAAPLRYRVVAVSLVAALLAGQLAGASAATYPFVSWGMYSRRMEGDVGYTRLVRVGKDGREEELPVASLIPRGDRQLRIRLVRAARDAERLAEGPERRRALETCEVILGTMAEHHRRVHPEASVGELRLLGCTVPVRFAELGAPECRTLLSVQLEEP